LAAPPPVRSIVTGTPDRRAARRGGAAAKETITLCESSRPLAVINTPPHSPADFILNRDFNFQGGKVQQCAGNAAAKDSGFSISPNRRALLGDSTPQHHDDGLAYQKGWLRFRPRRSSRRSRSMASRSR